MTDRKRHTSDSSVDSTLSPPFKTPRREDSVDVSGVGGAGMCRASERVDMLTLRVLTWSFVIRREGVGKGEGKGGGGEMGGMQDGRMEGR